MPDLGKYAVEVVSAYTVSLVLILALVALSLRQSARTRAALRQVEAAHQARAHRAPETGAAAIDSQVARDG